MIKQIFNVDKKLFNSLFLYGTVMLLLLLIIPNLFQAIMKGPTSKIIAVTQGQDLAKLTEAQLTAIGSSLWIVLILLILFLVIEAYIYCFFESNMWNMIFGKKITFKSTNKFLVLNLILGIIFVTLNYFILAVVGKFSESLMWIGLTIYFIIALFAVYLLYISYVSFGRTHELFKSINNIYSIGIKHIKSGIVPFIVAVIVMIAVNLIMLLFTSLNNIIFIVIESLVIAAYLAWFRIYFSNALKSVKI
jgi:hypothetical protein